MIKRIIRFLEKRNAASSVIVRQESPVPMGISLSTAVKSGYKSNGWVYRCIQLTQKAAASVPFMVFDTKTKQYVENHSANDLLKNPCPQITRQDFYELMVAWLELCGNAYSQKVRAGGKTIELWPISPDRINPVSTKSTTDWISGYAIKTESNPSQIKPNAQKEDIVHLKYIDPSNPVIGVGPLQAAAAAVALDNSQKKWSYQTSENKGKLEGIFTFDEPFTSIDDANAIKEKINRELTGDNAKPYFVLGSKAGFINVSRQQEGEEFIESQRFSRDEIHVIMGVPPVLTGAEQARYSNYQESETIFWFSKVVFVLQDIADGLTLALRDELLDNQIIKPDISNVPAIRRAALDTARTAEIFSRIGVPLNSINEYFEFGFDLGGVEASDTETENRSTKKIVKKKHKYTLKPYEAREVDNELKRLDSFSDKYQSIYSGILNAQLKEIEKNIEYPDTWKNIIDDYMGSWIEAVYKNYIAVAPAMGEDVIIQSRDDELIQSIDDYIDSENLVLTECSLVQKTTVDTLLEKSLLSITEGWNVTALQDAIIASGVFSTDRALMLARTISGTASSMGQQIAAESSGATHKRWINRPSIDTRPEHIERHKETENNPIPINGRYSKKFGANIGPRFPLDNVLKPADRCNCRCSQKFIVE